MEKRASEVMEDVLAQWKLPIQAPLGRCGEANVE